MLSFIVPKAVSFITINVLAMMSGIASHMQQLLDDWNFISPQLEALYTTLNHGRARHAFAFDPRQCMAPLPRAFQWADGSAYINHVELVRKVIGELQWQEYAGRTHTDLPATRIDDTSPQPRPPVGRVVL